MVIEWRNRGMAGMVIECRKWWNGGMEEWRNAGNGGTAEKWSNGGNGYIRNIYGTHTPTMTTPMTTTTTTTTTHFNLL